MTQKFKDKYGKVAVIMGDDSAEREVSLLSGAAVLNSLINSGVDAYAFDPALTPISDLVHEGFSRAVLMTHGKRGEDGTLQGALELLKIPYTGSGVMASSLAMDKYRTKLVWQALGIPVVPGQYILKRSFDQAKFHLQLPLPVIVKPVCAGSTLGFSRVHEISQLAAAIDLALQYDDAVLIEKMIEGDEFALTICDDEAYPLIKIDVPNGDYDYQNKYFTDVTRYTCPYDLGQLGLLINDYGVKAAAAIGVSGIARIDLLVEKTTGQIFFIEINTISGMTAHSLVPMAFKARGIDFADLCLLILDKATLNA